MGRLKEKKPGSGYVPERGDLIWLNFNPQSGHEQAGKRPAVVLSPRSYNEKVGLAICCPITSKVKGYPFEVLLPSGKVSGAILADQIRSLDWRSRNAAFIEVASSSVMRLVQAKIGLLLNP